MDSCIMSNQPKKQYTKHSGIQSPRLVNQLGEDVSLAEDLLEAVSADTPALIHFQAGESPYHTQCGTRCDYTLHSVPGMPGQLHFGVVCPRCIRALMEGEIWYALDPGDTSIHGLASD